MANKRSLNKVILIGNVGQTPEIRLTNSGKELAKFSLATSTVFKKDNEFKTNTEWHKVISWNQYDVQKINDGKIHKGCMLLVEGRIETQEYLKDDIKMYSTSIIAQDITILKNDTNGQAVEGAPDKPEEIPSVDIEDLQDPF